MVILTWTSKSGVLTRMPWLLQYLVILLPFAMSMVSVVDSGKKLPPIYWNSSNTLFNSNSSSIKTQIGDNIDIVCPYYPPGDTTPTSKYEYYSVYFVSKREYEECTIFNTRTLKSLINCTKAISPVFFTILVSSYQAVPGGIDFKSGKKYYLISTSIGSEFGVENQYLGACKEHNMRLILDLTNGTESTGTPSPSTKSTKPSDSTVTTTSSTVKSSTTPKPTTLPPTTHTPSTLTTTPTIKLPDGTPGGTNIVIDATGGHKNTGIISGARTYRPSYVSICWTLTLVTFMLLIR